MSGDSSGDFLHMRVFSYSSFQNCCLVPSSLLALKAKECTVAAGKTGNGEGFMKSWGGKTEMCQDQWVTDLYFSIIPQKNSFCRGNLFTIERLQSQQNCTKYSSSIDCRVWKRNDSVSDDSSLTSWNVLPLNRDFDCSSTLRGTCIYCISTYLLIKWGWETSLKGVAHWQWGFCQANAQSLRWTEQGFCAPRLVPICVCVCV